MTSDTTGVPRVNGNGHPCRSWCAQDHSRLVIPGKPEHGLMDGHWSDLSAHTSRLMVRLAEYPGMDDEPKVCLSTIYGQDPVFFTLTEAEQMAVLAGLVDGGDELAGLLRAAAAIAREEA